MRLPQQSVVLDDRVRLTGNRGPGVNIHGDMPNATGGVVPQGNCGCGSGWHCLGPCVHTPFGGPSCLGQCVPI